MTLTQLLAYTREQADDVPAPQLWLDATLTTLLNEAQLEACRRARLIKDTSTTAICRIDLVLNTVLYTLDPRIIFVRRVKLNSRSLPLALKRVRDMDAELPGWEAHVGAPLAWIPDHTTGKLLLYRKPDSSFPLPDFLTLTVVRAPLVDLVAGGDIPEIAPRFHVKLHHWVLYRIFSKQDAETYDPKIAKDNLDAFEAEFGKPSSANEEIWLEENTDFANDDGVY